MAEHPSLKSNLPRLDGVDLLRGLSILLVLLNHVNMRLRIAHVPYTEGLPQQLVDSLVWNGQRGVQIFFVISGFLITSTSLRRWGTLANISIRDFYRLRFARIAPLLLLLLAILTSLHFAQVKSYIVQEKTGGIGQALLAALTFHVNLLEATKGYLPGSWDILWSLSVEEVFYLFFPLLCFALRMEKAMIAALSAFVVIGPFARTILAHGNELWKEYSYLGGMDAIALGCLTAILVSKTQFSKRLFTILGGTGSALLILSLCFSRQVIAWGLGRNGLDMTVLSIGAAMLAAVAAQTQWRSPWMLSSITKLGQVSYEVYLTHMFVVFALFSVFVDYGKSLETVPLFFLGVILIAGLLGELVAHFYSEPMNKWLRRI